MLELSIDAGAEPAVFAVLAGVSEHPSDERVARLIGFVASELQVDASADVDSAPTPAQLAALITDEPARAAVLQRLVLAAMLVPPLTATRLDRLEAYAAALGRADEPALHDLRRTLEGRHRRLTAALMPRFPPTERLEAAWRRGGFGERWRFIKAVVRLGDRRTAARYQGLAELPPGTLGRDFFEHCQTNGFRLPGQRGGLPEPMVFHDMGHVLVGAPTDIDGEIRMAGFEAGCMGAGGFTMLEFSLLLFNLGAKLPTDAAPAVAQVDVGILLDSYVSGRRTGFDLLAWDPWADVGEPVTALRERYGIA
ncbi:hypothetical protein [Enhygromyxa salina]|uniref:Uncharacterized protein n=1 Tax=Enhygromyxa salina TaxID=215803 RepID=A0A2S9YRT1_9BACT|nr:hypothetical protein [Enhygromyxa salina]PRQ07805.1 hypothetical protein ENSA7_24770 [Enhygromyxa salina]